MSQSNTAPSASSASSAPAPAPAMSSSQAGRVLSKAVAGGAKKSALEKAIKIYANPATSIFEKVTANDRVAKEVLALSSDTIALGLASELAYLPAVKAVKPYSEDYGYNAMKSEEVKYVETHNGREFFGSRVGQPGQNMGKMNDMKSSFSLAFVNGLTSLVKHKVIRAMNKTFGIGNTNFTYTKATGVYTSGMLFGLAARAAANRQRQAVKKIDTARKHAEKQRLAAAKGPRTPRTKQTKEEKNAKARERRAEKKTAGAAGAAGAVGGLTHAQLSAQVEAQRIAFDAMKANYEALQKAKAELEAQQAQQAALASASK